jgi:signal transduction histidine kinase
MAAKQLFIVILFTTWSSMIPVNGFSQNKHIIDSLQTALKNFEDHKKEFGGKMPLLEDSVKANILNKFSSSYWYSNPVKSMEYAQECLTVSENCGFKKGIGKAYNSMGVVNLVQGNFDKALEYHQKALKVRIENKDKVGIAGSYNNIGNVYREQGNYKEALKYKLDAAKINQEIGEKKAYAQNLCTIGSLYTISGNYPEALKTEFDALNIQTNINDKEGMASTYNQIGLMYSDQEKYTEAIDYYNKARTINMEIGNKNWLSNNYGNLSYVNTQLGKYDEALKYAIECLKMKEELHDKKGVIESKVIIGDIYGEQGNYDESIRTLQAALKLAEAIGDKEEISLTSINISNKYLKQGKYQEALPFAQRGLLIGLETGNKEFLKNAYQNLASIYNQAHNYKLAYDNEVLFKQIYDSIFNKENEKKINKMQMQYDFDRQQDSIKTEQSKKDIIAKQELQDQTKIRNIIFISMAMIVMLLILLMIQRNKIANERRQKSIEQERSRISKDLHDDLGSELSKISLLSDIVNLNTTSEEMKPHLENISRSSKAMVENMGDIIWIMNAKNDQLPNLVSYIRKYSMEFFETTPISCHIIQPDSIPSIQIEGDFRRNIFLVVKEALNNILKHSEANKVDIKFDIKSHSMSITIHDNGNGIDESKLSEFGNGLVNMEKRMKDIGGRFTIRNQDGTVVEISIPIKA